MQYIDTCLHFVQLADKSRAYLDEALEIINQFFSL